MFVYIRFSYHDSPQQTVSGVFATPEAAMRDTCNFRSWRKLTEEEAGPYNVWEGVTYDEDRDGDMVPVGKARIWEEGVES